MSAICDVSVVLAALSLGLMAGALLAEACVLVPFWRSAEPREFLAWYGRHTGLLHRFFGRLEIAAFVLSVTAAGACWLANDTRRTTLTLAAGLGFAVLATFPLHFQRANASFARGTIALNEVASALRRWAAWHWARVAIAATAFALTILPW